MKLIDPKDYCGVNPAVDAFFNWQTPKEPAPDPRTKAEEARQFRINNQFDEPLPLEEKD